MHAHTNTQKSYRLSQKQTQMEKKEAEKRFHQHKKQGTPCWDAEQNACTAAAPWHSFHRGADVAIQLNPQNWCSKNAALSVHHREPCSSGAAESNGLYNTRRLEYWRVPHCRTNYGSQVLRSRMPHLLNHLIVGNTDIVSCYSHAILDLFLACK